MTRLDLDFSKFSLESIVEQIQSFKESWIQDVFVFLKSYEKDERFECCTSGTTGLPKKYFFSKAQLQSSANSSLQFFELKNGDMVLLALSVKFIAGKMMLVRAIEGGLKLSIVEPCSNPFKNLTKHDFFHFTPLVPLQLHEILNQKEGVNQLGKLLIGGAEVHEHQTKALQGLKVEAWTSFAMTETLTHFAVKKISPVGEPFYQCLPNFSLEVDANNCLAIINPTILENKVVSSDVVELISATSFVWRGRFDNLINSGGIKLSPENIEAKIKDLLPVDFIIGAIPDEKFGQKLLLYYEGNVLPNTKELLQKIKARLNRYELPKELICIPTFSRTSTGKIIRKKLKFKE